MPHARLPLGLPLGGIALDTPRPTDPPEARTQWMARDISGFYRDGSAFRPWPAAESIGATATDTITGLRNLKWGDDTYDLVRHTKDNFEELASGAWTSRAIPALTGGTAGNSDYWGGAVCPGNSGKGYYMFSTPVTSQIFSWTGSGNIAATFTGTPNPSRHIVTFADRCIMFNQLISGAIQGRTSQWSVPGDSLTWSGTGSGSREIVELPSPITAVGRLARKLFVYCERGIAEGSDSFDVFNPVYYEYLSQYGAGCWAPNSFVSYGNQHFFLSTEGFRSWDGQNLRNISDAIDEHIFRRLNKTAYRTIWGAALPAPWNLIVWGLPMGAGTTPNELWCFNFIKGGWYRVPGSFFSVSPTAAEYYDRTTGTSWTSAPLTTTAWNAPVAGTWRSWGGEGLSHLALGHSDGTVVSYSPDAAPSTLVELNITTPAWSMQGVPLFSSRTRSRSSSTTTILPEDVVTLDSISLSYTSYDAAADTTMYIRASRDGGDSYVLLGTMTLVAGSSSRLRVARLDAKFSGATIQLDISNKNPQTGAVSSPQFILEDLSVRVRRSGSIREAADIG